MIVKTQRAWQIQHTHTHTRTKVVQYLLQLGQVCIVYNTYYFVWANQAYCSSLYTHKTTEGMYFMLDTCAGIGCIAQCWDSMECRLCQNPTFHKDMILDGF